MGSQPFQRECRFWGILQEQFNQRGEKDAGVLASRPLSRLQQRMPIVLLQPNSKQTGGRQRKCAWILLNSILNLQK